MAMMNVLNDTLGGRLAAARRLAGLDQLEIGNYVGASRPTVSKWERGITEPTVSQLMLWAQMTNQSVEAILDGLVVNSETPAASATGVSILSQHSVRHEGFEPPTFCSVAIDAEYEALCIVEAVTL